MNQSLAECKNKTIEYMDINFSHILPDKHRVPPISYMFSKCAAQYV